MNESAIVHGLLSHDSLDCTTNSFPNPLDLIVIGIVVTGHDSVGIVHSRAQLERANALNWSDMVDRYISAELVHRLIYAELVDCFISPELVDLLHLG
jgi:hypothetical protein